ncbi:TPA: type II secretion system protein GspC [Raoultella planticola]|jgi:general secretion pathway protein C|uniref:General secretion pathway protein C n=1 Tax=Raoultella planticola TaxID=575 RepID=A0A8G2A663_RAOPL|nr:MULTISPECIES: type II secretion system protein GspC [Raoultella]ATM07112.1 type II secretion system protein GspC [Raoultella planticola]ATM15677.1 type II secretion system protein GspC [Raoultella planticola]AUU04696.1 type II secretion system protein GspC [Raoultella planticola]ELU0693118.1 type II secretion system protein GspC [Raoultella planticola]MBE0012886.1 type II secretion system protein GspC [Raoultella planticola]
MSNGIKRYISVMQLTLINKKYMHYAPHIAMLVTLLLIGQQLAKLSWRMILPAYSPAIEVNDAPEISPLIPAPKTELPVFTLFGRAEKKPQSSAHDESLDQAPLSSLKLRITGLLASSDAARSIVIMAKGNQQVSLMTGDSTPGNEARIIAILRDRIIVNYRGRNEAILLADDGSMKAAGAPDTALNSPLSKIRQQPQNILNYLNISPVMVNEQLSGYRLNPGKDPTLFRESGLHENDLAVALNGLDLRDRQQAQQALKQLPELSEITLTVEREGQRQDIYLALRDE